MIIYFNFCFLRSVGNSLNLPHRKNEKYISIFIKKSALNNYVYFFLGLSPNLSHFFQHSHKQRLNEPRRYSRPSASSASNQSVGATAKIVDLFFMPFCFKIVAPAAFFRKAEVQKIALGDWSKYLFVFYTRTHNYSSPLYKTEWDFLRQNSSIDSSSHFQ